MDAIPHGRPLVHQRTAPAGQLPQPPGLLVGHPNTGQEVGPQQLGQHPGVDLVGLDLGLGNGLRLHRIGDDHFGHEWPQDVDHGPGVGAGLQRHMVGFAKVSPRERGQGVAIEVVETAAEDYLTGVVEDAGFDHPLVDIESYVTYIGVHDVFSAC